MVMVHWSPAVAELDFLMAAMAMAAQVKITILAAIALWQMGWGAEIDTAPSESYGTFFDLEISVFWFFYLLTGANMSCFLADHQIGDGFGAGVSNVIVVKLEWPVCLLVASKLTNKHLLTRAGCLRLWFGPCIVSGEGRTCCVASRVQGGGKVRGRLVGETRWVTTLF